MDDSHIESLRVSQHAARRLVVRQVSIEVAALVAALFLAIPSISEDQRPMVSAGDGQVRSTFGDFGGNPDPVLARRQLRLLNAERQKEMVSDADKLLDIAKELNAEVAGTDSGTLNVEQMHEVDQIEKLAKNVKSKMELTVGGGTASPSPLVVP